jgi:hypothetical protein
MSTNRLATNNKSPAITKGSTIAKVVKYQSLKHKPKKYCLQQLFLRLGTSLVNTYHAGHC